MIRAIFCDFDGVLASWRDWYSNPYHLSSPVNNIENKTIQCIDRFAPKDTYFIPTSSWSARFLKNIRSVNDWLRQLNCLNLKEFKFPILQSYIPKQSLPTSVIHNAKEYRPALIKAFIEGNNIDQHICLDDESEKCYIKYGLNIIKTDPYEGITFNNITKIYEVFEQWKTQN